MLGGRGAVLRKDDGRFYNSCAVVDADGEVAGVYRKIHVPDIPLWEENFYFSAGDRVPRFSTRHGRIGVQIRGTTVSRRCAGSLRSREPTSSSRRPPARSNHSTSGRPS